MNFSRASLHPPLILTSEHKSAIEQEISAILAHRKEVIAASSALVGAVSSVLSGVVSGLAAGDTMVIPLTTVSLQSDFDAYIDVSFVGSGTDYAASLLLDSGNSMLIVPNWEDIAAIPNWTNNYQVLGTAVEPWGCPANVLKGPIRIGTFHIDNCVFYACTADSPQGGGRTANFGAGCLAPWSASSWNAPQGLHVTMQAPLSYSPYSIAEFNYEAATDIISGTSIPKVATGSNLTLYKQFPAGYSTFAIVGGIEWMSLIAKGLTIGSTVTSWPGAVGSPPIAMIDTGGGPVFLTDPNNYVSNNQWPDSVQNPEWTSGSTNCQSIDDSITIEIGDDNGSYQYVIDPNNLPASVRGLTLVMCTDNQYMMGNNGMNIGGISVLGTQVVVDYGRALVGLKPRQNVRVATSQDL